MHQSLWNFNYETTRTLRCWKAVKQALGETILLSKPPTEQKAAPEKRVCLLSGRSAG